MADNRAFSTGVMNEGGSPVYYEDKKLSERSAVSGAAAIANLKFLLVNGDDDGFNTAIKAYIDEAVRSAFGALVDNLDKGTAISRVLATDANHDLGSITPANLASVLGDKGLMKGELSSGNINYIEFGVYNLRPEDSGSSLVNCPSSFNGTLIAFRPLGTYYVVQLYFASDNDKTVYYRLKTSDWWGWRRIQSVAM